MTSGYIVRRIGLYVFLGLVTAFFACAAGNKSCASSTGSKPSSQASCRSRTGGQMSSQPGYRRTSMSGAASL
jgi:hypothetical protein